MKIASGSSESSLTVCICYCAYMASIFSRKFYHQTQSNIAYIAAKSTMSHCALQCKFSKLTIFVKSYTAFLQSTSIKLKPQAAYACFKKKFFLSILIRFDRLSSRNNCNQNTKKITLYSARRVKSEMLFRSVCYVCYEQFCFHLPAVCLRTYFSTKCFFR